MKKTELFKTWTDLWLVTSDINKIVQNVTGFSKGQLFLIEEIDNLLIQKIKEWFDKLKSWEPLEYIIKNAEFYSLDFYVDQRVLIPRDETELLVDKAIDTAISKKSITLIDVWTWSSCIPISIIKNSSKISNCFAIDISEKALEVSKLNIEKHSLTETITQIHSDLIKDFLWETYIETNKNVIITANLPYIKNNDFENIDKETMEYEPALALYWWEQSWFELYEKLISQCFELKKTQDLTNLSLFIEIWFDQYDYSKKYIEEAWLNYSFYKDNNWINRCVKINF